MNYKDLTEEQKSKIADAKGPEDILAMAREEGYELSDEELQSIAGGVKWSLWCSSQQCYQVCSADYA